MLTLLLGGARSGKSAMAERLGFAHDGAVTFIATSPRIEGDLDLARRIADHRSARPSHWATIEEETDLAGAISAAPDSLVIVDCLTLWLNNLLHRGSDEPAIREASAAALNAVGKRSGGTIVISNEVGLGIVPEHALARSYRDQLGWLNQDWARVADRAFFLIAGRALALHDLDEVTG